MISFQPTEEQEIVRDTLREFAAEAARPIARECDEASKLSEEFLNQVWELGLVSTSIPVAYGGGGEDRSPTMGAIVLEELACGDATLAVAATAGAAFVNALIDFGTGEQQKTHLPLFCDASPHSASLALVEPGPIFDPSALATTASRRGDVYVLHGTKSFVPMGDRASHFLVVASSGDGRDAFIVAREASGLTLSEPEKNLGLRALPVFTLGLEGVEVPAADRLGGDAGADIQRLINASRVGIAAVLVGISRAVLEYVVPYAVEREAFDQAIAQKQAIAFKCADMQIETDACRWMTWKAASQLEQGIDATRAAHHAHGYVAEKAMWITDNGVQVLGGHGFIREHPVEMWYRNARTLGVLEGLLSI